MKHIDIYKGDKFYFDNYGTKTKTCMPDYLIVTKVTGDLVEAKYENRAIHTKERTFSKKNLIADSNLNPDVKNPQWVFIGKS